MVSPSTKKTLIISVSAIVGLTATLALVHMLIQDDRRAKHHRKIRAVQKQLNQKLDKVETSVQELVEGDIRFAQVRIRTLRTCSIFPGDHCTLDQIDLGEIQETPEELARERSQGYDEDSQKARQGYKRLDFLVNSVNERMLRLLESLDAISPRELTDLVDMSRGVVAVNGMEMQAFEKIRKRKRRVIDSIHGWMAQMDKIGVTFKDRIVAIEEYEKKIRTEKGAEVLKETVAVSAAQVKEESTAKEVEEDVRPYVVQHTHVQANAPESHMVKKGLSFAEVASHNIKKQDAVQTEDAVSHSTQHEHEHEHEHTDETTTTTTTTATTTETITTTTSSGGEETTVSSNSSSSSSSGETLTIEETSHHHHDTEKILDQDSVSAEVQVLEHSEEQKTEVDETPTEMMASAVVVDVSLAEVPAAH
ncbi:hypothetical protein B0O80DRAFT_494057 [Mortierella sp. GBAus27b]|nr:hypothetical protein BGX31_009836 [Mortierella sp. GBA43]KAI8361508.1 hypothetical protein B0O80DRAFT_494057 [Mortierella sp. GBAus27b]